MGEQINITVTDLIPPDNLATIDANGKLGNAVSKNQFNLKIQNIADELDEKILQIQQQVETDFKGTLSPQDAAPSEDGSYKPTISSKDNIDVDPVNYGTLYVNAGNLRAKEGYDTMFYKKGTAWTKSENKKPDIDYNTTTLNPDSISKAETGKTISKYFKNQTILPRQTSFLKEDIVNVFDKSTSSQGYLNQGVFASNPNYLTSDFTPCQPGDIIRCKTYINWACYDDNKNLVVYDTVPGSAKEFIIPDNTLIAYFRIDAPISEKDTMMIVINIPYPQTYVGYGQNDIEFGDDNFKNLIVSTIKNNQLALREKHFNLLDTSKLSDGFFNSDGSINANPAAKLTDFIPVQPGKTYYAPGAWDSGYFDSNKGNFQLASGTGGTMVIPSGVYYMRVAIPASTLTPTSMIYEKTQNPVDFIPYSLASIISTLPAEQLRPLSSSIRGKKWGNIGDSIANFTTGYRVLIPTMSDCDMYNYAVDGGSYAPKTGQTMVISEEYVNMSNDLDIITVHAGVNDVSGGIAIGSNSDTTNATFKGALNVTYKGLIKKYLGKKIGIITPIQRQNNSDLLPYVDAIKDVAKIYGIPVLDLNAGCGLCPDIPEVKAAYFDDIGLHPNRAGHKVFANKILSFLESL
ncbi:SGNH/GDSL hydrolase family protein [Chryseobacterium carnipullorum]|uniref:SGNH/GDSL hydrolase family protein n=1 Tax=Chryseobacterium carnipullorum TaxID=1124835 RepID=A0A376DVF8_CHRCU|nr:SGNH/GDSL hydrolase family protein [Chryseobacterium carnipullorum]AZA49748.1 SGNH/GDSL hydrolase family protein [Chryseobacterium carnipullorum]AZA64639.1 SGNH/GDSL hydrolase family protein [Chryseobacterium carnipullorum]STC95546.1 Uncharacterised protein [Chryseobacterium carnipullorum]